MLKILQVRLQQYVNQELLFKLNLEKAEDPEIKLPTFIGSQKKWEFQVNIYFCSTDYTKDFDCVDHNKLLKILKEVGIPDHLICLLRKLYAGQEATVRTRQQSGSKLGKEYVKPVYCHTNYLTYMQSTLCEVSDWMKHKLESRLLGEISITSYTQMTSPLWQEAKRN